VKSGLFTIGTITLPELGTLMSYVAPKISSKELKFDFLHTLGEILVDQVPTHLKVQDL
jgi:hypothetical protein